MRWMYREMLLGCCLISGISGRSLVLGTRMGPRSPGRGKSASNVKGETFGNLEALEITRARTAIAAPSDSHVASCLCHLRSTEIAGAPPAFVDLASEIGAKLASTAGRLPNLGSWSGG